VLANPMRVQSARHSHREQHCQQGTEALLMLLLATRLSCSRPQLLHRLPLFLLIMHRHLQLPLQLQGEVLYLPPALLLQLPLQLQGKVLYLPPALLLQPQLQLPS